MAKVRRRTWQGKDGIPKTAWEVDCYIDGQRHKKSGFKTKGAAEKHLRNIERLIEEKESVDKSLTFKEAANNFMALYADIHCKESTTIFYDSLFKNHLIPYFGSRKIHSIKPDLINEFIMLKIEEELSEKTINHLLTLLHTLFQKVIENDKLLNNPMDKVKRLKLPHQEMSYLQIEQIDKLLSTCKQHYEDFYPFLLTALFTGMRKGELLALTWEDVNLKTGKININKGIYRGTITTPKTNQSIRKIDMPKVLINELKEYKLKSRNNDLGLVFCNQVGKHLNPDNLIKRRFDPCLRKAGLDKIRFHDLRHTYACMLITQNVPIKYIQQQLGHNSIQVTLDTYGHVMPNVHDQAVKVLDKILGYVEIKRIRRKRTKRKGKRDLNRNTNTQLKIV